LNKLSKLLVDNLELGIINVNKKGFISSINNTAEKIFKDKDNIYLILDDLTAAADKGLHRIVIEGNVLIFIYKIDTPQGTTLVVKDISDEDKIDKLKLINTIASVLAHEIKNPVSSIAGVSELIRTDKDILSNQDQKHKLLGIIDRESIRLTNLVEEFLIYSGSEKRKNEGININALIQNACDNIRVNKEFIEKKLHLDLKVNENSGSMIYGDFQRLSQAFDNVLINSVQACQKDGKIFCTVKDTDGSTNVIINDSGIGITDDIKKRIFEPFFTTKERGTGLGLAIVRNIISAHGGKIEVKQNNPGTTFNIMFPKNRS
ncbi:MAG: ATP-binding protein, partial [Proteobacteria bacterium]|nr:ATP-binding protein [Pseudomonadota bacterium]